MTSTINTCTNSECTRNCYRKESKGTEMYFNEIGCRHFWKIEQSPKKQVR